MKIYLDQNVLIINTIILGMMAGRVNVLSQRGVDEKEQWKAFRENFLPYASDLFRKFCRP